MSRAPLVLKFRTPGAWYLYDAGTNRILRISETMYKVYDLYRRCSSSEAAAFLARDEDQGSVVRAYDCLHALTQHHGVLSDQPLKQNVPYWTIHEVEEKMSHGVGQCTLEVTQQCNMRCRYCTFSGGYQYNRSHTGSRMDWPTAKAGIDLFAARNRGYTGDFCALSFYGGEPLLEVGLIQRAMDYARTKVELTSSGLHFSMTTNGTLLTDNVIRCLAQYDVTLLISLDGPKEDHNRNRILADGSPTHALVMEHVRRILDLAPEYYERRVSFSVALAPQTDLLRLEEFVETSGIFRPYRIRVNDVAPGHEQFFAANPPYRERSVHRNALMQQFVTCRAERRTPSMLAIAMFEEPFVKIHKRPIFPGPIVSDSTSSTCFPGGRKIFVACDGTIHICEKMNPHFPIGHVRTGLDAQSIVKILDAYAGLLNDADCLNCWAFRLCTMCFATLDGPGTLSESAKRARCPGIREAARWYLAAYCWAEERNPEAWTYLDSYTIA